MKGFERIYRDVIITVVSGDITSMEVEAIVNPANSLLIMGGGVAGAIARAGGREIQIEARQKAPVPVGHAVATRAGRLKAKYVIHAPTMEQPAMLIGKQEVRLAVGGALNCARQLGITAIAFPGMGTGVGGLDAKEAANAMVEAIKRHIEAGTSLRRVVLVGFKGDLTDAFKEALTENVP